LASRGKKGRREGGREGGKAYPEIPKSLVPLLFLRPKDANQEAPRRRMVGATATVSTLVTWRGREGGREGLRKRRREGGGEGGREGGKDVPW